MARWSGYRAAVGACALARAGRFLRDEGQGGEQIKLSLARVIFFSPRPSTPAAGEAVALEFEAPVADGERAIRRGAPGPPF